MLNKRICHKCYQKYEIPWTKESEKAWKNKEINCPPDSMFRDKLNYNSWIKKILAVIFGSLLCIEDDPPRWCEFKGEHK